jgi:hypothetical protein
MTIHQPRPAREASGRPIDRELVPDGRQDAVVGG